MTSVSVAVFFLVYLGMILGGLPFLQLDRTGVAVIGAIVLIASGDVSTEAAARSIHAPTLILLFAFMVLSAQLRLGGFYARVTRRVAALPLSPPRLLGVMVAVVGVLSAVFSNDVVCLAIAPVLARVCLERRLDPVPYLLALAGASNVGSALTLIGNPQNMLIGQTLQLPFGGYVREAAVPVVLGLAAVWGVIVWQVGGRWDGSPELLAQPVRSGRRGDDEPRFDAWQTTKGLAVAAALVVVFLFAPWPRDLAALAGAGVLLLSRRLHSRDILGLVDWEVLVMFGGLFVVNHAFAQTGLTGTAVTALAARGWHLQSPPELFAATFVLSNVISNVPAVMLLLPFATHPMAGTLLALSSTLAGNLLIVGSIANILVVDAAAREGIVIDWRRHARVGIPVTIATLAITAVWLWVRLAWIAAP